MWISKGKNILFLCPHKSYNCALTPHTLKQEFAQLLHKLSLREMLLSFFSTKLPNQYGYEVYTLYRKKQPP